jgi:hypothetical protein
MTRVVLGVRVSTVIGMFAAMVLAFAAPASGAVVGACHVSPIVADLDRSLKFYRDLLGLEASPAPSAGTLPWDTGKEPSNTGST